MCVAVIVEDDKSIPAKNLKAMHDANSDGAGVAWMADGVVHFRKGLTWEQINALQDILPRPFLMHYRIATRGPKIPELTHPFPIGEQAFSEDLTGISDKGVIIHNGTWPDFRKFVPEGVNPEKCSDTQVAAYVAAWDEAILTEVRWSNAIMKPDGVWYRGSWERFEGNLYSNMHWKRELYDWSQYQGWQSRQYSHSRTPTPQTPIVSRKKGSHQGTRNQENGRTVGSNTVQSNGKTISENRAEKRKKNNRAGAKTQPLGVPTAYEKAKQQFDARRKELNIVTTRANEGEWDGERLFQPEELPNYGWNKDGKLVAKNDNQEPISFEKYLAQRPGPSVKCDNCEEEVTQIPCQCEEDEIKDRESADRTYDLQDGRDLDTVYSQIEALEDLNAMGEITDEQCEIAITALLETGESAQLNRIIEKYRAVDAVDEVNECEPTGLNSDTPIDLMDVEDMNEYAAMGLGLDSFDSAEPLQPEDLCLAGDKIDDWKQVDDYIRSQGIKI